MAEHTISSLSSDIEKLIEVHNELREIWQKDKERIAQYQNDEGILLKSNEVKEFLQIKTSSQLTIAKKDGLPFHTIDGIGARYIKWEVLEWVRSKEGKRNRRINVAAAM